MAQEQLETLRKRINDTPRNADGRRRYTAPLKRDLVAYARARQAEGWKQRQVAEALGVSKATVCCWIGNKGTRPARSKTKAKAKARSKASRIKPVVVTASARRTLSAPTLVLANGHRIEGLSVEQLITVAKAL